MTQPAHTAAIAAMLADIESNAVRTTQQNRDHAILTILADLVQRVEALDHQCANRTATIVEEMEKEKTYKQYVDTFLSLRIAIHSEYNTRLAALESWREQMTGDGK